MDKAANLSHGIDTNYAQTTREEKQEEQPTAAQGNLRLQQQQSEHQGATNRGLDGCPRPATSS